MQRCIQPFLWPKTQPSLSPNLSHIRGTSAGGTAYLAGRLRRVPGTSGWHPKNWAGVGVGTRAGAAASRQPEGETVRTGSAMYRQEPRRGYIEMGYSAFSWGRDRKQGGQGLVLVSPWLGGTGNQRGDRGQLLGSLL